MLENVPILSLLILIPLIGALITFMLGKHPKASKIVALVFTAVPMALSVLLLADFSLTVGTFQYVENFNWISSLGISYKVGVDGISIAMVFLTTLLSFLAVLFSWDVEERTHQYMGLMLILEVGVMGVFTSMDYFLFYVFWEVVLIPMYFLIAIWGGPRRSYASIKFFIYTHIASLVMLLGILALYFQAAPALGHATFDMQAIASVSGSFGQLFQIVVFGALFLASSSRCRWCRSTLGFRTRTSRRRPLGPSCWPDCCLRWAHTVSSGYVCPHCPTAPTSTRS